MNVITRGIRNAFRNVIRTFSIVMILGLSIGLSLAMLIAHQAVGQKISSVKSSVGNTVSISPAGVRGTDGGGNALTDAQLSKIKTLAHVNGLSESLNDRLTSTTSNLVSAVDAGTLGQRFAQNNGTGFNGGPPRGDTGSGAGGDVSRTFTPPVSLVGTTAPTDLSASRGGGTFKLTSGQLFNGMSNENVALIGTTLAAKNNLKVGSNFTAYGSNVTVAGIFDAGNAFSNNQVIMPLLTVQTLSSQAGAITSATAQVDSLTNVDTVTAAITKDLGSAADVTNAAAQAKQAVEPLQSIQTISLYSLIGATIAGAVIILLTMVMIVRERRREIGVIKAIGASNAKVVMQFMAEAFTLTSLGAVVGTVLGILAGNPITRLLVTNSTITSAVGGGPGLGGGFRRAGGGLGRSIINIHAAVGWSIILDGLLAAIVIALVGSALASFFIAKVRPAEVMRAE